MVSSRKPISGIIFDAGDILVHKIPDNKLKIWDEVSNVLNNSKIDFQTQFTNLYDKVRTLGANFSSECVSTSLSEYNLIKISLIEKYEIEKWWENPDPLTFETISKLWELGYKIGILTDSARPSSIIREVLGRMSNFFHQIVSSRDIGVMKPDKKMYSSIISALRILPRRALFIAHDPDEIKGAIESGLLIENYEAIGNLQKLVEVIQQKYFYR
ncbi:MAG: HAD family hydrolase [Promethearchaeota archaeon]